MKVRENSRKVIKKENYQFNIKLKYFKEILNRTKTTFINNAGFHLEVNNIFNKKKKFPQTMATRCLVKIEQLHIYIYMLRADTALTDKLQKNYNNVCKEKVQKTWIINILKQLKKKQVYVQQLEKVLTCTCCQQNHQNIHQKQGFRG